MRHFNEKRELVESPPNEFRDDIEYMSSMDTTLYYLNQPEKSQFPDAAKRQKNWWDKHSTPETSNG